MSTSPRVVLPRAITAPPREVAARALLRPFAAAALAGLACVVVLRLAVRGALPTAVVAVVAPLVAFALVAASFRAGVALGPLATDERGEARPLARRHGFAVVALAIAVSLPMLGAFSLVDPWETHYAEVAREMIERRDVVSPWWAHEGVFMSKPVLTFWLEALAMKLLGVGTGPDEVLAGGARPEWAVRLPAFVLAVVGAYVLYNGVSRTCGRRAGLLGAVALLTMPGYALLSHQALTDMPLVACTAAALGLVMRALATPDEAHARTYAVRLGSRATRVHAGHAVALAFTALVLPQLVGLVFANVRVDAAGLHFVADRVGLGSPHACGLPGQPACTIARAAHPMLAPWLVAALFAPVVLYVASALAEETRVARLFAVGAWMFASLAAMAKGPAGLVVPAGAALVAIASRRTLRPLRRLEIPTGILIAVALVAPWYVAVYARHGRGFLDELVLRHMLGRTLDHLHDTNSGEDVGIAYFVKQLGWATFPWCGLLAGAFVSLPSRDDGSRRSAARALLAGAAILAFTLVSAMRTKFHHYVLVALPPCAMVLGMWLDERLAEAGAPRGASRRLRTAALAALAACVVALVARDLGAADGAPRLVQILTYRYDREWPTARSLAPWIAAFGVVAVAASALLVTHRTRARGTIALAVVAVAFAAFTLDVYLARAAKDGGQRGVLEAYYRDAGARPEAPLVAYQLNWKGENFYTANHVAIFVSSGPPMKAWIAGAKAKGTRTFWFVTERRRIEGLRAELGSPARFDVLTGEDVSYEFALVRAEP
jgi:4-amino-4-deoxy-L-arabinose transferase-like glycosyltransferase